MTRRLRRTIKPLVLLLNAWRFKCSEQALAYLHAQREDATAAMHREHVRQVGLRARREQIARW